MKLSIYSTGGTFRGTYAAGTQYYAKEIVKYDGHAYVALQDTLGNLPSNAAYWEKMVPKPEYPTLGATDSIVLSGTTVGQGDSAGTRRYWFGEQWGLTKESPYNIKLSKVYQNCNCNCNNAGGEAAYNNDGSTTVNDSNEHLCTWLPGGVSTDYCLFQCDHGSTLHDCNCTPNCNDGNCYSNDYTG